MADLLCINLLFLWRFHAVHHSLREMNAWNSNHHFTEEIFRIPFVAIPLSLLFQGDPGYVPAIIIYVMRMQGQFEHSSTKFNLGFLRYIIADNRYHRIHHSIEQRHWNKNFGFFTPLWDIIFGSVWFPQKKEWPNVGLPQIDEPKTLSDFLWRPFRNQSFTASSSEHNKHQIVDKHDSDLNPSRTIDIQQTTKNS